MLEDLSQDMLKYKFAMKVLLSELDILFEEYEFKNGVNPVEHIRSRIKTVDSAEAKLERKGYEVSKDNLVSHIHDMVGVRIVVAFLSDVYDVVDIITRSSLFQIKSQADYIKNPKKSGYSSYHLNVYVPVFLSDRQELVEAEIQIRTMAMDFWASLEHKIRYKVDEEMPEGINEEIAEVAQEVKNLDVKMLTLNKSVKGLKKNN